LCLSKEFWTKFGLLSELHEIYMQPKYNFYLRPFGNIYLFSIYYKKNLLSLKMYILAWSFGVLIVASILIKDTTFSCVPKSNADTSWNHCQIIYFAYFRIYW
jgi:hypothetical protein